MKDHTIQVGDGYTSGGGIATDNSSRKSPEEAIPFPIVSIVKIHGHEMDDLEFQDWKNEPIFFW